MQSVANITGYRNVAFPTFASAKARVARPIAQDTVCFGQDKKKLSLIEKGIRAGGALVAFGLITFVGGIFTAMGCDVTELCSKETPGKIMGAGLFTVATGAGVLAPAGAAHFFKELGEKSNKKEQ